MAFPTMCARSSTLNSANAAIAEVIPNRFRAWRRVNRSRSNFSFAVSIGAVSGASGVGMISFSGIVYLLYCVVRHCRQCRLLLFLEFQNAADHMVHQSGEAVTLLDPVNHRLRDQVHIFLAVFNTHQCCSFPFLDEQ